MITDSDQADLAMDAVFHALAHGVRRRILDLLRDRPGQGVGELAKGFDVSRIAIMNHLAVLEKAGLVVSERDGRVRRLYLNAAPIQMIHDRWTDEYSALWAGRVTGLKYAAEAAARKQSSERKGK
ncbi:helix-turn-helix transcriptional regulator [Parasphingopyxis sp. CP4]|uniref:ArsR/SmtB family transcription factor n=1 Tax=Parasphingopyxis sp. CP4 TaxID=2724527 RepID=UPI001C4093CE|nr:helix-turn-helix transcriptional regulator [Parasphingopyxis sp. CP4]